jgi:hypothetical protein
MVPTPSLLSALAVRFYTEEDKTVTILGDSLRYDTCIYLGLNYTMERANSAVIERYGLVGTDAIIAETEANRIGEAYHILFKSKNDARNAVHSVKSSVDLGF